MVKVKYTGTSNYREITAADWTSIGFKDQGKTVWDRDNARGTVGAKQVHELSEEAAQWLLDNEPEGDFEILEEEANDADAGNATDANPDASLAAVPPALPPKPRRVRDAPQA